jgi:PRTRC genetic system protein B
MVKTPLSKRGARPYQREVELATPPRLQLDFYENCVVVTRRKFGRWTSYPINPAALASVLGKLPASSGLLPPNTLATGLRNGRPFYVVYVPARTIRIQVEHGSRLQIWTIPTPPLVWSGCIESFHIWALASHEFPASEETILYNAPFPNVFPNASICWGSSDGRAPAAPATLMKTLDLFLTGSRFSPHAAAGKSQLATSNVLGMLSRLNEQGATEYPLDDLVPHPTSFASVLRGQL